MKMIVVEEEYVENADVSGVIVEPDNLITTFLREKAPNADIWFLELRHNNPKSAAELIRRMFLVAEHRSTLDKDVAIIVLTRRASAIFNESLQGIACLGAVISDNKPFRFEGSPVPFDLARAVGMIEAMAARKAKPTIHLLTRDGIVPAGRRLASNRSRHARLGFSQERRYLPQ